jgi:hypothetical protein
MPRQEGEASHWEQNFGFKTDPNVERGDGDAEGSAQIKYFVVTAPLQNNCSNLDDIRGLV